jgi:hypothetical protein
MTQEVLNQRMREVLNQRIKRTCRCSLEDRQIDYTRSKARRMAENRERSAFELIIDRIVDEILAEKPELEGDFETIENEAVLRFPEHYERWSATRK